MLRLFTCGLAIAFVLSAASAEDKDVVTWERDTNGIDLKIEQGKDKMKFYVFSGENGVIATCEITVENDGTVKAKVTAVEEKGNFPNKPKEGLQFTYKWKVDGDKATLSDLSGEGLDEAKPVVEGEWKKKK